MTHCAVVGGVRSVDECLVFSEAGGSIPADSTLGAPAVLRGGVAEGAFITKVAVTAMTAVKRRPTIRVVATADLCWALFKGEFF